jgi:hypothetical protein
MGAIKSKIFTDTNLEEFNSVNNNTNKNNNNNNNNDNFNTYSNENKNKIKHEQASFSSTSRQASSPTINILSEEDYLYIINLKSSNSKNTNTNTNNISNNKEINSAATTATNLSDNSKNNKNTIDNNTAAISLNNTNNNNIKSSRSNFFYRRSKSITLRTRKISKSASNFGNLVKSNSTHKMYASGVNNNSKVDTNEAEMKHQLRIRNHRAYDQANNLKSKSATNTNGFVLQNSGSLAFNNSNLNYKNELENSSNNNEGLNNIASFQPSQLNLKKNNYFRSFRSASRRLFSGSKKSPEHNSDTNDSFISNANEINSNRLPSYLKVNTIDSLGLGMQGRSKSQTELTNKGPLNAESAAERLANLNNNTYSSQFKLNDIAQSQPILKGDIKSGGSLSNIKVKLTPPQQQLNSSMRSVHSPTSKLYSNLIIRDDNNMDTSETVKNSYSDFLGSNKNNVTTFSNKPSAFSTSISPNVNDLYRDIQPNGKMAGLNSQQEDDHAGPKSEALPKLIHGNNNSPSEFKTSFNEINNNANQSVGNTNDLNKIDVDQEDIEYLSESELKNENLIQDFKKQIDSLYKQFKSIGKEDTKVINELVDKIENLAKLNVVSFYFV